MTSTWALVPVKPLRTSKTRLGSVLRPDECAALSKAMLLDVISALEGSPGIDHIAVLTSDPDIQTLTDELGHTVIHDTADQPGTAAALSTGLNNAADFIAREGGTTVCIIPADLPSISAADIDELLERHGTESANKLSLCPAIRDGGTNALVCSPPDSVRFCFGTDSANKHIAQAEKSGLAAERLSMHAFFRDIDTPDDLLWLSQQENCVHTSAYLRDSGIFARLYANLNAQASA